MLLDVFYYSDALHILADMLDKISVLIEDSKSISILKKDVTLNDEVFCLIVTYEIKGVKENSDLPIITNLYNNEQERTETFRTTEFFRPEPSIFEMGEGEIGL
jgi:chaperonin GroEL (HSP60 family)